MYFRTDDPGKWGTGLGRNLSNVEVDSNFWELVQALQNITDNPAQPVQIVSATSSGNELTFTMSDGSTIGPVYLPILEWSWRDQWLPNTPYYMLDVFVVDGVGLYSVLQDHMSPATFDENYTVDGNPAYFKIFGFAPSMVKATSPAHGDVLRFNAATGFFENVRAKYIISSNLNGLMSANQDLLHHRMAANVTFPPAFGDFLDYGSGAGCIVPSTGNITIRVQVASYLNLSSYDDIGTLTYNSSSVEASLATVGGVAQTVNRGDVVRFRGPNVADATLSGFYATLVGWET